MFTAVRIGRVSRGFRAFLICATLAACSRSTNPEVVAHGEAAPPRATAASAGAETAGRDEAQPPPVTLDAIPAEAPAQEEKAPAGTKPKSAIAGPGGLGLSGIGQGGGGRGVGHGAPARAAAPMKARPSATAAAPNGVLMPGTPVAKKDADFNTEGYSRIVENPFLAVKAQPLSTFSVDVDTASYANSRRFITNGQLPPKDAIRVEEWINYFSYDYAPPTGDAPVAIHSEVSSCPWNPAHQLVRVGIKGKPIDQDKTPPRNLVFLLDVSGSMESPDKLPLLKNALSMLSSQLRPQDKVAIVVYAGSSGLVLPATSGARRDTIKNALSSLEAGGSTNGGEGIELAYKVAQENFVKGGINRVILATDGDFNVGTTSEGDLSRLVEEKRKSGVFLTVLGFGTGNVKDNTMEMLADKGNGNYAYIDGVQEARKVLVKEAGATLVTIAKDVKLQVEFNPARVASYRLVGYENRLLAKEDFNDDKKDAGEMGAGHTVTAFYEVVPVGAPSPGGAGVDALKYQTTGGLSAEALSGELMTVKVRYKKPDGDSSVKISHIVTGAATPFASATPDQRFAAAVAEFALALRGSEVSKGVNLTQARDIAAKTVSASSSEERRELIALMDRAIKLGAGR